MKQPLKKFISISVLIILIALAAFYISSNWSDFTSLKLTHPLFIIIVAFLTILVGILIGLINYTILIPLKVKIGVFEAYALGVSSSFYNLITPFRGGIAARAIYLKKKHEFPITKFLSSLAAIYVVAFFVASLVGFFTMYVIYITTGIFNWIIFILFLIISLGMVFIILFSPNFPETRYGFINRFIKVINGWRLIRKNPKVIYTLTILTLAQVLLSGLRFYFLMKVFDINITIFGALLIASIGSLGLLISITPAGLGINEAIIVFTALTLGITPAESLSAAILGRLINTIILFILGPIFSWWLLRYKPNNSH